MRPMSLSWCLRDVPDLPGLVLAKLFKVLHRTDIAYRAGTSAESAASRSACRCRWPTGSLRTRSTSTTIRSTG